MSHSKLPWTCELSDSMADDEDAWLVLSEDGDVAEITSPAHAAEADAALIVRAVNSFHDLLAALKGLVAKIDQVEIDSRLGDETDRVFAHYEFDEARAAIARAEKGT